MTAAFEILSEISDAEMIAAGRGVCIGRYLDHTHGRGRWRKMKGIATVRLADGTICEAEIHRRSIVDGLPARGSAHELWRDPEP